MNRTLLKILVLLSLLFISVGSTVAYLTDVDQDVNVMTLDRVEIDLIEQERNATGKLVDFQDNHPLYPGVHPDTLTVGSDGYWVGVRNAIDKIVTVKNTGKAPAYVRLWFAFESTEAEDFLPSYLHINQNSKDWEWLWFGGTTELDFANQDQKTSHYVFAAVTYQNVLEAGATTPASLRQIMLDSGATNDDFLALGDKYNIFVVAQGMQSEGFDSAEDALNEGFGKPSLANNPFKGMTADDEDEPVTPPEDKLYGEAKQVGVAVKIDPQEDADTIFTIDTGHEFEIIDFVIDSEALRVTWVKVLCAEPYSGDVYTAYIAWGGFDMAITPDHNETTGYVYEGWNELGKSHYCSFVRVDEYYVIEADLEQYHVKSYYRCSICGKVLSKTEPHAYDENGKCVCGATGVPSESADIPFTWTTDGTSVTITKYTGSDADVVIPATIDGLPVTTIGPKALDANKSITSIILPESIKIIEYGAFAGCDGLTSISIPASVVWIGEVAFAECDNLTSIQVVSNNSTYASRNGILYSKDFGKLLAYPGGKHGSYSVPDDVTIIGNKAFSGCSGLTSITIPDSVTSIGDGAFSSCTALTSIVIPNSITSIQSGTFSRCASLTSITIPTSVISIGDCAFTACTSLSNITLPDSVTSIGAFTFSDCTSLRNITIPASVTIIGGFTFSGCSTLTVNVYSGSYAHTYCVENDIPFELLDSDTPDTSVDDFMWEKTEDGEGIIITEYMGTATELSIPSTIEGLPVTSIGGGAFFNCASVTNIILPDSVTHIGSDAFYHCTSLKSIVIPDGVTSIGQLAFSNCINLVGIILPASLSSIGGQAFLGCTSLTNINIPEAVTNIRVSAFGDCSNLQYITIPDSVNSIAAYAFEDCTSLTRITIPDSVTSISGDAFSGCDNLTIYASAGSYAEKWCTKYSFPFQAI